MPTYVNQNNNLAIVPISALLSRRYLFHEGAINFRSHYCKRVIFIIKQSTIVCVSVVLRRTVGDDID